MSRVKELIGYCTECDKLATSKVAYGPRKLARVTQERTRLLMPVGICEYHDRPSTEGTNNNPQKEE